MLMLFLIFHEISADIYPLEEKHGEEIDLEIEDMENEENKEANLDVDVSASYHGDFSLEKIGYYASDPSRLIKDTSVSIDGKLDF